MKNPCLTLLYLFCCFILSSCGEKPAGNFQAAGTPASITPEYSGIVIPPNIAPLNFRINEPGKGFFVKVVSSSDEVINVDSKDGKIRIPQKSWSSFTEKNAGKEFRIEVYVKNDDSKWLKYNDILNAISVDKIDPYLYYRLLYPGYESWAELSINMRRLEDFSTRKVIENGVAEDNCVNCHSFNNGKTDDFLFHMRGTLGGTYFYSGKKFSKVNLKTKEMKNGAVYPRWHPSGRFVAFSTNKIIQRFHSSDNKKVEVSDLESSLVLYDVEKNEMSELYVPDMEKYMDTYPEWSPDGRYIYFCRAAQTDETFDYQNIRYDLYRMTFNPSDKSTGLPELVFDARSMNKSVAFPRISPDGRFLVFTLADYGCFPIWHKEADLWLLDLSDMKAGRCDLNSDFTDSYHSWSSNGKWLVFSSKRDDGLTARPYISYIDGSGNASKPFILPQEDPDFYDNYLKSFNIPELANTDVKTGPGRMRKASFSEALQAKWSNRLTSSVLPGKIR
ncbi:MAG: TolB family protein [Chloroflexota bacterium]